MRSRRACPELAEGTPAPPRPHSCQLSHLSSARCHLISVPYGKDPDRTHVRVPSSQLQTIPLRSQCPECTWEDDAVKLRPPDVFPLCRERYFRIVENPP